VEIQLFIAGILFIWIGVALRGYAIGTLGRNFTVQVRAQSSQQVVTAGPYRYIRHPSYAGGLLAAMGIALALGNWFGLALVVAVLTIAFAYRIAVEEQALASALGAPYIAYMRKTWRVIPGLV
jgi:protein-S-isoprenylcysteine O-methyltransferase